MHKQKLAGRVLLQIHRLPLSLLFVLCAAVLDAQERTPVILQVPSINVQQTYAYGEQRGFFKEQGVDIRTIVIKRISPQRLFSRAKSILPRNFKPPSTPD